tara:strand:+ start:107 stop:301 length:195 start_codon:yes stop_codon:yes gene_type:complete
MTVKQYIKINKKEIDRTIAIELSNQTPRMDVWKPVTQTNHERELWVRNNATLYARARNMGVDFS